MNNGFLGFTPDVPANQPTLTTIKSPDTIENDVLLKTHKNQANLSAPNFLILERSNEKKGLNQNILKKFFQQIADDDGYIGAVKLATDTYAEVGSHTFKIDVGVVIVSVDGKVQVVTTKSNSKLTFVCGTCKNFYRKPLLICKVITTEGDH